MSCVCGFAFMKQPTMIPIELVNIICSYMAGKDDPWVFSFCPKTHKLIRKVNPHFGPYQTMTNVKRKFTLQRSIVRAMGSVWDDHVPIEAVVIHPGPMSSCFPGLCIYTVYVKWIFNHPIHLHWGIERDALLKMVEVHDPEDSNELKFLNELHVPAIITTRYKTFPTRVESVQTIGLYA